MKTSVKYLGHIISRDGIGPDPETIDKIVNYKTPVSADEVRSFLGLAGYYRRFIPNFGSLSHPLRENLIKMRWKIRLLERVLTQKLLNSFVHVLLRLPFWLIQILILNFYYLLMHVITE